MKPPTWMNYQPYRNRPKEWHDIKLDDGTIVKCCWPNGEHWYPAKVGRIHDKRVHQIRRCPHPLTANKTPETTRT